MPAERFGLRRGGLGVLTAALCAHTERTGVHVILHELIAAPDSQRNATGRLGRDRHDVARTLDPLVIETHQNVTRMQTDLLRERLLQHVGHGQQTVLIQG